VGPLFAKRGDRVKTYLDFWIWFGTPGPISSTYITSWARDREL